MRFSLFSHPQRLAAVLLAAAIVSVPLATMPDTAAASPARTEPVWLPVHSAFGVDCAGKNPGCHAKRDFYSIDVVPAGQFTGRKSHAKVYAMGAGTVHIGKAHGTSCGSTSKGSFGTWVWIDHGNGVKSRYGHLSKILVRNGRHVAAGAPLGVVGTTGKAKNCGVSYLDFEIIHGKLNNDNAHRFATLQACTRKGKRQTWPRQAASREKPGSSKRVHYSIWDHVRHGTQFPATGGRCA